MNRERAAFLFEYISDLIFSLVFMYIGGRLVDDNLSMWWVILGIFIFSFGITYLQYTVKHLITGK